METQQQKWFSYLSFVSSKCAARILSLSLYLSLRGLLMMKDPLLL